MPRVALYETLTCSSLSTYAPLSLRMLLSLCVCSSLSTYAPLSVCLLLSLKHVTRLAQEALRSIRRRWLKKKTAYAA